MLTEVRAAAVPAAPLADPEECAVPHAAVSVSTASSAVAVRADLIVPLNSGSQALSRVRHVKVTRQSRKAPTHQAPRISATFPCSQEWAASAAWKELGRKTERSP